MVKIQDMSTFDLDTSFFLDQLQPLKWNGLPDIQKQNIGIGRLREPVTVKTTTTTTTKDFNRPCSISSKLTASFYVVSFLLLKRKNDKILMLSHPIPGRKR